MRGRGASSSGEGAGGDGGGGHSHGGHTEHDRVHAHEGAVDVIRSTHSSSCP